MEKDKYYTPEIEELHVGFEYEFKQSSGTWVSHLIPGLSALLVIWKSNNSGKYPIRVKYLDQKDIESFGFHLIGGTLETADAVFSTKTGWWHLHCTNGKRGPWAAISKGFRAGATMLFSGTVKNKSELKRILKQIGYEKS